MVYFELMSNLSIIEKQSLSVLEHLEYMIDLGHVIPLNKSGVKIQKYDVTFGDIDFKALGLPKLENFYGISKYLRNNGVMFTIDFDLVNDHPAQEVSGEIYDEDMVHLGSLEGPNIKAIRENIASLKQKIVGKNITDNQKGNIKIVFNIKKYSLNINADTILFDPSTLDWSLIKVLVEKQYQGKTLISWDEVLEFFNGRPYTGKPVIGQKQVGDSRDRLNRKIKSSFGLKENLITRKKNQYSLTKKVTKK